MPAAAVASFTPAIAGMSGISVGASGEMAVDMGASGFEQRKRSVSPQSSGREILRGTFISPSPGGGGSVRIARSKMRNGVGGRSLNSGAARKDRPSPHPAAHFIRVDPAPRDGEYYFFSGAIV